MYRLFLTGDDPTLTSMPLNCINSATAANATKLHYVQISYYRRRAAIFQQWKYLRMDASVQHPRHNGTGLNRRPEHQQTASA